MQQSLLDRPALVADLIGEFDDQNAVLGRDTDQHDDTDLTIDVQRVVEDIEPHQGAGHGERHGQHDDEGVDEALELRRQHQEHDQKRQSEEEIDRVRGILVVAGVALVIDPGVGHARVGFDDVFQIIQRLAELIARREIGGDGDRAIAVEPV